MPTLVVKSLKRWCVGWVAAGAVAGVARLVAAQQPPCPAGPHTHRDGRTYFDCTKPPILSRAEAERVERDAARPWHGQTEAQRRGIQPPTR